MGAGNPLQCSVFHVQADGESFSFCTKKTGDCMGGTLLIFFVCMQENKAKTGTEVLCECVPCL